MTCRRVHHGIQVCRQGHRNTSILELTVMKCVHVLMMIMMAIAKTKMLHMTDINAQGGKRAEDQKETLILIIIIIMEICKAPTLPT